MEEAAEERENRDLGVSWEPWAIYLFDDVNGDVHGHPAYRERWYGDWDEWVSDVWWRMGNIHVLMTLSHYDAESEWAQPGSCVTTSAEDIVNAFMTAAVTHGLTD